MTLTLGHFIASLGSAYGHQNLQNKFSANNTFQKVIYEESTDYV